MFATAGDFVVVVVVVVGIAAVETSEPAAHHFDCLESPGCGQIVIFEVLDAALWREVD